MNNLVLGGLLGTPSRRAVLKALVEHYNPSRGCAQVSNAEISISTGACMTTVSTAIQDLKKTGLIIRERGEDGPAEKTLFLWERLRAMQMTDEERHETKRKLTREKSGYVSGKSKRVQTQAAARRKSFHVMDNSGGSDQVEPWDTPRAASQKVPNAVWFNFQT